MSQLSLSLSLSLPLSYSSQNIIYQQSPRHIVEVVNLKITWYVYDINLTFYLFIVCNYKYDKLTKRNIKVLWSYFVLQILLDSNGHVSFINHWSHHTRFCSSSISCITFKKGLQRTLNKYKWHVYILHTFRSVFLQN